MSGVMSNPSAGLHRPAAKALCAALCFALAPACSTARSVPPGAGGAETSLRPGDRVRIVTVSGPKLELTFSSVTEDAIHGTLAPGGPGGGAEVAVPLRDVAWIELSAGKSPGLVAAVGEAVVSVLAMLVLVLLGG